jgi:hypothetical protein
VSITNVLPFEEIGEDINVDFSAILSGAVVTI